MKYFCNLTKCESYCAYFLIIEHFNLHLKFNKGSSFVGEIRLKGLWLNFGSLFVEIWLQLSSGESKINDSSMVEGVEC